MGWLGDAERSAKQKKYKAADGDFRPVPSGGGTTGRKKITAREVRAHRKAQKNQGK